MAKRKQRAFVWIPPNRTTIWTCSIAGIDITDSILDASFPHGLIEEELICEIELDNSSEEFTNRFKSRDTIQFKMDFADGSTVQFEGEVEEIKSKIVGGFPSLGIKGAHFTSLLLDVMVTEDFINATVPDIRKSLINDYFTGQSNFSIKSSTETLKPEDGGLGKPGNIIEPGFTTQNVSDDVVTTEYSTLDIKFVNKPLLDCLIELNIQGEEDTYIDFNKDFHAFKKEKNLNDNVAVVDDDFISLRGLGTDSAEVRNKVIVYGESGQLPVIRTSEDNDSQETFRTKEKVITDTTIESETQANTVAIAEKNELKNPRTQGIADTLFMVGLRPGDMVYVISPPHNIHARFRVVKFVFRVPSETMEIFFNQERSIPKLFKDRIRKDLSQEVIVNPNRMSNSYNFGSTSGFNQNNIDGAASNDIQVVGGNLQMQGSVEFANMVSITSNTPRTVNSAEVRVIGETLTGTRYYINAEGTNTWQQVTLDTDTGVTTPGKKLRLRIEFTTTTARIPSAVILYK